MNDKQSDNRVRFLAKLPPDLHRWLKVAAAQDARDMNDLLVLSLETVRLYVEAGTCISPVCSVAPEPHKRQAGCPGRNP